MGRISLMLKNVKDNKDLINAAKDLMEDGKLP